MEFGRSGVYTLTPLLLYRLFHWGRKTEDGRL
jgi:hypothetical protein